MNASEALEAARAAGVRVVADSGHLLLDADSAPPAAILDALKRYKAEILVLLAAQPAKDANRVPLDDWVAWVDMPDVVTVVEDLADEGMKPGRISRELGLSRPEVVTILRRTGR
jgi:hypothetical protein